MRSSIRDKPSLPIMIGDMCSIKKFAEWQEMGDHILNPKHGPQNVATVTDIFEALLTQDEPRTLIIPREVYIELFPSALGRLDMYRNEDGKADIMTDIHYSAFRHQQDETHLSANAMLVMNMLQHFKQEGRLRVYESTGEMLRAGEISQQPEGSIVIVDTHDIAKSGNVSGEKQNKRKPLLDTPFRPSPRLDYFPPLEGNRAPSVLPSRARGDQIVENQSSGFSSNRNGFADAGDREILKLSKAIAQNSKRYNLPTQHSILTDDMSFRRTLNKACQTDPAFRRADWPLYLRSLDLVTAMDTRGMLERTEDDITTSAVHENARFVEHVTRRGRPPKPIPADIMKKDVAKAVNWLEITSPNYECAKAR